MSGYHNMGGRMGHQQNYRGDERRPIDPWESGPPLGGPGGGGMLGSGLLPNPNAGGGDQNRQASRLLNQINQINSTEAQLAIANNLLSLVLQPAQHAQQQQQPLLNLAALTQLGNRNMSSGMDLDGRGLLGDGPEYRAQREVAIYDQHQQYEYEMPPMHHQQQQNRGFRGPPDGPGGLRGMQGGYHGGRGGGMAGGKRNSRGGPAQGGGGQGRRPYSQAQSSDRSGFKGGMQQGGGSQRGGGHVGPKVSPSKGGKDQKINPGRPAQQSKPRDGAEEEKMSEGGMSEKQDQGAPDDGRTAHYYGVPASLLHCHVCEKNMWDGVSFENHLKGQGHNMMMDKLQQGHEIECELKRSKIQMAEEQKLSNAIRLHKSGKGRGGAAITRGEFCRMCNLQVVGSLVEHRKCSYHQELKRFLHPHCKLCDKEFTIRIAWEKHLLSGQHLRAKATDMKKNKAEEAEVKPDDGEKSAKGDPEGAKPPKRPKLDESPGAAKFKPPGASAAKTARPPTDTSSQSSHRDPICVWAVQEIKGWICTKCRMFFRREGEAKDLHCRSRHHYQSCKVEEKNTPIKKDAEDAEDATEEESISTNNNTQEANWDDDDDDDIQDDSGNWKRRAQARSAPNSNEPASSEQPEKHDGEADAEKTTDVVVKTEVNDGKKGTAANRRGSRGVSQDRTTQALDDAGFWETINPTLESIMLESMNTEDESNEGELDSTNLEPEDPLPDDPLPKDPLQPSPQQSDKVDKPATESDNEEDATYDPSAPSEPSPPPVPPPAPTNDEMEACAEKEEQVQSPRSESPSALIADAKPPVRGRGKAVRSRGSPGVRGSPNRAFRGRRKKAA